MYQYSISDWDWHEYQLLSPKHTRKYNSNRLNLHPVLFSRKHDTPRNSNITRHTNKFRYENISRWRPQETRPALVGSHKFGPIRISNTDSESASENGSHRILKKSLRNQGKPGLCITSCLGSHFDKAKFWRRQKYRNKLPDRFGYRAPSFSMSKHIKT